ncbi:DDT domain-containing protein DDR4-like [Hibiscus syriacus]|uniref:DDT domain-containing protein DDR4-like n=1 Tax=Hibiscus syriacus TaxID=106335 RepID=UPI0019207072|nr:DDT domain-containing protein DDR4-like [Hibiscus syriacus]
MIAAEVAIGKTINDDVIPVVEKFQKKKERTLNRKKRQEMLLSSFRSSCAGMTRTCRNHRPISYTFDEYDRAIDEAIEITKRRKTIEEQSQGQKLPRQTFGSNGGSYVEGTVSKDSSDGKANSMGSETEDDKLQKAGDNGNEKEDNDDDYSSETDGDVNNSSNLGSSADENENLNNHKKHVDGITRMIPRQKYNVSNGISGSKSLPRDAVLGLETDSLSLRMNQEPGKFCKVASLVRIGFWM